MVKNKKQNMGGRRSNSGRKPVADKKVQLYVFVHQSKIDKLDGKDAVKLLMMNSIDAACQRCP